MPGVILKPTVLMAPAGTTFLKAKAVVTVAPTAAPTWSTQSTEQLPVPADHEAETIKLTKIRGTRDIYIQFHSF